MGITPTWLKKKGTSQSKMLDSLLDDYCWHSTAHYGVTLNIYSIAVTNQHMAHFPALCALLRPLLWHCFLFLVLSPAIALSLVGFLACFQFSLLISVSVYALLHVCYFAKSFSCMCVFLSMPPYLWFLVFQLIPGVMVDLLFLVLPTYISTYDANFWFSL